MQNIITEHPVLFVIALVWSLIWKGIALWRSAQRKEKAWFISILILNTLGILDIVYIYFFSRREKKVL